MVATWNSELIARIGRLGPSTDQEGTDSAQDCQNIVLKLLAKIIAFFDPCGIWDRLLAQRVASHGGFTVGLEQIGDRKEVCINDWECDKGYETMGKCCRLAQPG